MAIRILSFDFDGCLYNKHFRCSAEKDVIASNLSFLESLKKDNSLYEKNIGIIGSNRQSKRADDANLSSTRGSCFPQIKKVTHFLEIDFNPFLLADIYGELPHGVSFANAINPEYPPDDHKDWMFDLSKVTVLYAQMHKFAKEHYDKEIIFDFFDDKGLKEEKNILEWLQDFYTQYPQMIPPNVTLRLHHYRGGPLTTLAVLKGNLESFIDKNYEQTVKDMARIVKKVPGVGNGVDSPLDIGFHVKPEMLTHRKPFNPKKPTLIEMGMFNQKPDTVFPPSYNNLWQKTNSNSKLTKARALLADYTKQDSVFGPLLGRLFTGHWNRHHVSQVQKLLHTQYESADDLIYDLKQIEKKKGGSLDRRVEFIELQIQTSARQFSFHW